jgi:hypothetical protein
MAKKDFENVSENLDRRGPGEEPLSNKKNNECEETKEGKETEVKNAHAAGMGAIGRNDQRQNNDADRINDEHY